MEVMSRALLTANNGKQGVHMICSISDITPEKLGGMLMGTIKTIHEGHHYLMHAVHI